MGRRRRGAMVLDGRSTDGGGFTVSRSSVVVLDLDGFLDGSLVLDVDGAKMVLWFSISRWFSVRRPLVLIGRTSDFETLVLLSKLIVFFDVFLTSVGFVLVSAIMLGVTIVGCMISRSRRHRRSQRMRWHALAVSRRGCRRLWYNEASVSGAQDRREMLEEIMRRGTSSLGNDVPSEREINRLAARSDEEFWLFEKMDEERRQKENYRSRLMEEHELPDWVYSPLNKDDKAKNFFSSVSGKRKRKEVVYADTLSDLQWMKAVENGQDMSKLSVRGKRREYLSSDSIAQASDNTGAEENLLERRTESARMANERTSEEDSFHVTPASKRFKPEGTNFQKHAYEDVRGSGLNQHVLSWNTHRKKRSSYPGHGSLSDTRGQNSNGRANWN